MKKFLLAENGNFYKANLHCHTNLSDGDFTPEQVKQLYLEKIKTLSQIFNKSVIDKILYSNFLSFFEISKHN